MRRVGWVVRRADVAPAPPCPALPCFVRRAHLLPVHLVLQQAAGKAVGRVVVAHTIYSYLEYRRAGPFLARPPNPRC